MTDRAQVRSSCRWGGADDGHGEMDDEEERDEREGERWTATTMTSVAGWLVVLMVSALRARWTDLPRRHPPRHMPTLT